jgi:hypothetical protein
MKWWKLTMIIMKTARFVLQHKIQITRQLESKISQYLAGEMELEVEVTHNDK